MNNQSRREVAGEQLASVSLRFRTTLPSAILFYRGHEAEYLFLELLDGILRTELKRQDEYLLLLEELRVDDGHWHKVEVVLQNTVQLKLWHDSCDAGVCMQSSPIPHNATPIPHAFLSVYIGGAQDPLANNTQSQQGFVGCLEDLQVDAEAVLPVALPVSESGGHRRLQGEGWAASCCCRHVPPRCSAGRGLRLGEANPILT